jgi:hypothetical protein
VVALFLVAAIQSILNIAGCCMRKSSFTTLFAIDRTQRSAVQIDLQHLDVL